MYRNGVEPPDILWIQVKHGIQILNYILCIYERARHLLYYILLDFVPYSQFAINTDFGSNKEPNAYFCFNWMQLIVLLFSLIIKEELLKRNIDNFVTLTNILDHSIQYKLNRSFNIGLLY